MILLSALLASLTGLVAGERQPLRAQVEASAHAIGMQAEAVATQADGRSLPVEPAGIMQRPASVLLVLICLGLSVGAFLSRKQSWLN